MVTEPARIVVVFNSVHDTLKAETYLTPMPWKFTVRPVPPAINKGCGLGIEISAAELEAVKAFLLESRLQPLKYVTLDK